METISKITQTKLYEDFGTIIENLNIDDIDKKETIDLKALLQKHQLLIVKSRTLTPKEQVVFSKKFGELETFPFYPTQFKDYPEIFRLSTDIKKGHKNVGFYWHQDGSFDIKPTPISIFHLIKIPKSGGETLFSNAYKVYDLLPEEMKTIAEHLKTVHAGGIKHDLVITHPITGKKAIYINFGLTHQIYSINNSKKEDIRAVIDEIERIINLPDVMYAHSWEEGDIVVIDNYSVFHQATRVNDDTERTLHRTTIKGSNTLNDL
ncbi:TauD/TfdA dioxygenase family protein [Aquimarina algiphila]|uniref:TauD/TfdA dioxygenase family protein n=1 Tax=Aquimarina algiphila TaxID=2047982 RepID=UPI00232DEEB2|nr:TauD/TfdA family dioxygenase [Aquimarina algiphila]